MTLDTGLTIGFGVWGVIASLVAFFSITRERLYTTLVRNGIKKLPKAFTDCAEEYRQSDNIPDNPDTPVSRPVWDDRVRKKDMLAARLGGFALGRQIGRSLLAEVGDDGYLVALAEVITAQPEQSDIPLLAKATNSNVPHHVSYRLLSAITALARAGCIKPMNRKTIHITLDRIENHLSVDGSDHKSAVEYARAEVNKPYI